jgi:hypothetical protein
MEKPMIDAMAQRLDRLERENRRWKWVAGVSALCLALSLTLGGLTGSRAVVAQPPQQKSGHLASRPMAYQIMQYGSLYDMEKTLQHVASQGWELVQVVPTDWSSSGQGQAGRFERGVLIVRGPMLNGK